MRYASLALAALSLCISALALFFLTKSQYWFQETAESIDLRLQRLEAFDRFSGRNLIPTAALRRQATAGPPRFLEPPVDPAFPIEGDWRLIGGEGLGWDSADYEKIKAIEVHRDALCVGMGVVEGGADVFCFDDGTWRQIGGDGIAGSWPSGSYVQVLFSHEGALFAGVDHELWRLADGEWRRVGAVGADASCSAYSAIAVGATVYLGTTGCGLELFRVANDRLERVTLDLGGEEARYSGIYELFEWQDRLVIGAIAQYGPAGVFLFDPVSEGVRKIGGDGVNGSWINPGFSYPESFAVHRGNLVVSFNRVPQVQERISAVWTYDGDRWAPLGLRDMPALWYLMNNFNALLDAKGRLFVAGGGLPHGMASVWYMDEAGRFRQLGGGGLNGSWGDARNIISQGSVAEYVYRLELWNDTLVAGFGDSPGLAQLWAFYPRTPAPDE